MTRLGAFADGFGRGAPPPAPPCPPGCAPCSTELPSTLWAERLVGGDLSAIGPVLAWTAARAMLVSAGLYAGGVRGPLLVRAAIGGSLAVEAFVIGMAAVDRAR